MSIEQDVGLLQGEVKGLTSDMEEVKENLKTLTASVNSLNLTVQDMISQGKGGWKIIVGMATLASAVGGIVGTVIHYFKG
jgi:hypothetical protein